MTWVVLNIHTCHTCVKSPGASLLSPLDWKPLESGVFSPSSQLSPTLPQAFLVKIIESSP